MHPQKYVLVTPARDEARTIEITIRSVISQTVLPEEWIIVSDRSTDGTDQIVQWYEKEYPFIRLVSLQSSRERSFASVVHATESGIKALKSMEYDFLGLLDADLRFASGYFGELMARFAAEQGLGLAGGIVIDVIDGKLCPGRQYLKDVAGATQFFRRECFESIGGLVAIPEGGWDAITCFKARANGYDTATFPDLVVEHLKPRNISQGNIIRQSWQYGKRDYAWGSHPIFEMVKCASLVASGPPVIGASLRLAGYAWCCISRKERVLGADMVKIVRGEQVKRILPRALLSEIFK